MAVAGFEFHDLAGLMGVFFYLAAYAGLQFGWLSANRYRYSVLNLIAASLVLFSLMRDFNFSSAILNVLWVLISIVGITRVYRRTIGRRFSAREERLLDRKLPGLSPYIARRFLDAGDWREKADGDILAVEGREVGRLIFVDEGRAKALVDSRKVGELAPGDFIGEVTWASGGPASASVVADGPMRVFEIETPALRDLADRFPELRACLDLTVSAELYAKIVAANRALADNRNEVV